MLFCYLGHMLLALSLLVSASQEFSTAPILPALADDTSANAQSDGGAIEAELNSLLQQHGGTGSDNKLLTEAIISRLMLGNLSEANLQQANGNEELLVGGGSGSEVDTSIQAASTAADQATELEGQQQAAGLSAPETLRLRKLMSYLHNYEIAQAASGQPTAFGGQYPVLPAGQASTIKRASAKMGNILKQQQMIAGSRQAVASYGRNNFDFGLGKRPDSSVSGNILRFGDSSIGTGGANGHVVSGSLGKRPSAHRFDFGLGKRVASPAYPRYDFGLGKRAPNRIRYDFGLGK